MQYAKPGGQFWPSAAPLDPAKSWLLDAETEPVAVEPHRPQKGFRLKELYELLDCATIEVVRIGSTGLILIVDEEGKFKPDPQVNVGATLVWWDLVPAAKNVDVILGKAILCKSELLK